MTVGTLRGTGKRPPLPAVVRILLGASFVSDIGAGLTLPLLLIYLHAVRHIGLGLSGLLIGGATVLALPVGPWTGALVDKVGPKAVALGSLGIQGLGTAALVLVRSPASAIVPMLLFGVGEGASWPAWNALLATVVADDSRPRVFALSFQLLNLGLGLGAVVTGAAVQITHPASFELVYVLDGGTTLLLTAALAALPGRLFVVDLTEVSEADRAGGYRRVLSDRRFRRYLIAALLLAIAGYGAVSTGLVGFATTVVGVTPRTIAWAFAANTAVIALMQPVGLRMAKRMRRTVALSAVALIWAASWGVLELAGAFPRSTAGDALVIAMFAVFALGEILLSPVAAPLVNDLAPPELRGRYNALASTVYSLSSVVSPVVSGALLGAGLGRVLLGLLAGCCVVAVASFTRLRKALSGAEDHAPELSSASG